MGKKYEGRACPNCGAPMVYSWFFGYKCSGGGSVFCPTFSEEAAERKLKHRPMASELSSTKEKSNSSIKFPFSMDIPKGPSISEQIEIDLNTPLGLELRKKYHRL